MLFLQRLSSVFGTAFRRYSMKRHFVVFILSALLLLTGCSGIKNAALDQLTHTEALYPGTVVINEAMTDNTDYAKCSDGKHYDWIELHNTSSSKIILTNCYLSDDENVPAKWLIPSLSIEAYGYALIYMSDRDCLEKDELHASFKLSSDGETVMLYSPELTELARLCIPPSEENLSYGLSEEGTGCGWYAQPTPMQPNSGAFSDTIEGLNIGRIDVVINEYMINNTKILYDADGDYSDWIELYNRTENDLSLDGYSLCDSSALDGKWYFPEGTVIPSKGYLLIFCSGKDKLDSKGFLHTSFRLSTSDDMIALLTPLGYKNSYSFVPELDKNVSAVLAADGTYLRCSMPTPGRINNTSAY